MQVAGVLGNEKDKIKMWLTDSNLEKISSEIKVRKKVVVVGRDSRTKQTYLEDEQQEEK